MSNLRNFATVIFTTVLFVSCVNDSEPINEEEVITTLTVTLVPEGGGEEIVLSFQDLDGDGTDDTGLKKGTLAAGVTYNGSIELLNETEIDDRGRHHQGSERGRFRSPIFLHGWYWFRRNNCIQRKEGTGKDSEGNYLGIRIYTYRWCCKFRNTDIYFASRA